jgi:phospholipid transport system substrate-binding protein
MPTTPERPRLLLSMTFALLAGVAYAADDSAAGRVQSVDNALLRSMRAGSSLGAAERYQRLAPVIERAFDLPTMTRLAVGPAWSSFSPAQQRAAIAAFSRLTIASFAHNFSAYGGERFEVDPGVVTRGPDKIVHTQLIRPHGSPIPLTYQMRESGGSWRVIDVYYGAISQLAIQRPDIQASIASGGAPTLIAHLNSLSGKMMD